jgi:tryptophanyl-tRNA synthetase
MNRKSRILSGVQPSGTLHIGNYFGMMKSAIDLQDDNECYYFIADYHALTQCPNPDRLRQRKLNVAIDFLACGIDPRKTVFFCQSDVPQVTELTWILNCYTPTDLLERCQGYMDKVTHGLTSNNGLFTYPVLMAADILIYGATLVPVGNDQKQHLEITRDIAIRFNNAYGEVLTVPDYLIKDELAVIPGIDGQKMSKSYNNIIELFGDEQTIRDKIMRIRTESAPTGQPKAPDSCNIFALFKLFASETEVAELRQSYLAGGMKYDQARQALFEKYWEYFRPFRQHRQELVADMGYVQRILQDGARRARHVANDTLAQVKKAVGLS